MCRSWGRLPATRWNSKIQNQSFFTPGLRHENQMMFHYHLWLFYNSAEPEYCSDCYFNAPSLTVVSSSQRALIKSDMPSCMLLFSSAKEIWWSTAFSTLTWMPSGKRNHSFTSKINTSSDHLMLGPVRRKKSGGEKRPYRIPTTPGPRPTSHVSRPHVLRPTPRLPFDVIPIPKSESISTWSLMSLIFYSKSMSMHKHWE